MTSSDMRITSIAPWFGSKRTLAPRIIAELGKHSAYWEPFCGSMAVLLAKEPATMETVNDLHGDLVNLARVVQDRQRGPMLYRRLRRLLMSRVEFAAARKAFNTGDEIDRAEAFFVASWMGRNGVAGTKPANTTFSARYSKNGGHAARRFSSAVDSIPAWRRRLRGVTIASEDAFAMLGKIEDSSGVVIYCDPPYLVKGAKYLHDFDEWDHQMLFTSLRRFTKARVVVSYYEHSRLREMYDGWTFVECPTTKAMVNAGARDKQGAVKAPEILIINGPSYTKGGDA